MLGGAQGASLGSIPNWIEPHFRPSSTGGVPGRLMMRVELRDVSIARAVRRYDQVVSLATVPKAF